MVISQKSLYALRALFELSKRIHQGPVKISVIAEAQVIPQRFLEVILNRLKQAGIVESRRGNNGGYYLAKLPKDFSVGDVLRIMQGPIDPVPCLSKGSKEMCALYGGCIFLPLWKEARDAVNHIYDTATFEVLLENEKQQIEELSFSYAI